jgi:hypothetical protein
MYNITCGGSCTLAEQIAWLSDVEGFYSGNVFANIDSDLPGNWKGFLGDASKAAAGFANGADTMWMWGDTNTKEGYRDYVTALSVDNKYIYFIVYAT